MGRRLLPALAAALLLAAGCGEQRKPLALACTDAGAILAALAAPAPAIGGAKLEDCVTRAHGEGELQDVGAALVSAAETLAGSATRDHESARRLASLVDAVRRGAGRTNGVAMELSRRVAVAARNAP